jgi:hypothetical protein
MLCLAISCCLPGDLAAHDGDAEQAHPADRFEAGFRPLIRGR